MVKHARIGLGVILAVVVAGAPVAAQGAGSPAPSAVPSGSPAQPGPTTSPSPATSPAASTSPGPSLSSPAGGPRWAQVRDRDVRRAGMLWHAVTLGDEVIALASRPTSRDHGSVRVLATPDGATWTRRGTIEMFGTVNDLLADGATLYAAGWDEGAMIWRSDDAGATWVRPADLGPFAGGADGLPARDESAEVAAIVRGPAGLVAVGVATDPDTLARRAAAWRSTDGLAWERLAEVGALPEFHAIAADEAGYVAVGSSLGVATSPPGGDTTALRWSPDGQTWSDGVVEIGPLKTIDGVISVPGAGFLAWGLDRAEDGASAVTWSSTDGRTWERRPDDPALAGVNLASMRSLEGGALTMAVGGAPQGALSFPLLGEAWRRNPIRARQTLCVTDVASVRAILVVVGGTCAAERQHGRAWTTPLEP